MTRRERPSNRGNLALATVVGLAFVLASTEAVTGRESPREARERSEAVATCIDAGLRWLAASQHPAGGWGQFSTPANRLAERELPYTAYVGSTFLKAGETHASEHYGETLQRTTAYVLEAMSAENLDARREFLKDLDQTHFDHHSFAFNGEVGLAIEYLALLAPTLENDQKVQTEVAAALQRGVDILQVRQQPDGGWYYTRKDRTRSSAAAFLCNECDTICCYRGLETARLAGAKVDPDTMHRVHMCMYHHTSIHDDPLFSIGEKMRAAAPRVYRAHQTIREGIAAGKLEAGQEPTIENLTACGVRDIDARTMFTACQHLDAQFRILKLPGTERPTHHLRRNDLLTCGAVYFRALLIGESLATTGGALWDSYQFTLESALVRIPNRDGSWPLGFVDSPKVRAGKHGIWHPAFATATAVQCLTLRNREEELRRAARASSDEPKAVDDADQQPKSGTADGR